MRISRGAWYKENGCRHTIDAILKAVGFTNIVIDVIHGGGPELFEINIAAFVKAHEMYLIDNGDGRGMLPFGFNLLVIDNLSLLTNQNMMVTKPTDGSCNFFKGKLCNTM